jgi:hypothetical protein
MVHESGALLIEPGSAAGYDIMLRRVAPRTSPSGASCVLQMHLTLRRSCGLYQAAVMWAMYEHVKARSIDSSVMRLFLQAITTLHRWILTLLAQRRVPALPARHRRRSQKQRRVVMLRQEGPLQRTSDNQVLICCRRISHGTRAPPAQRHETVLQHLSICCPSLTSAFGQGQ